MSDTPRLSEDMTEADLQRASEAVALLVESAGWIILSDLLDRQRVNAGLRIVEGADDRPIDWWRGWVAHINAFKGDLNTLVEAGRELQEKRRRGQEEFEASVHMGAGSLSQE